jgi:hypothetical protein
MFIATVMAETRTPEEWDVALARFAHLAPLERGVELRVSVYKHAAPYGAKPRLFNQIRRR